MGYGRQCGCRICKTTSLMEHLDNIIPISLNCYRYGETLFYVRQLAKVYFYCEFTTLALARIVHEKMK